MAGIDNIGNLTIGDYIKGKVRNIDIPDQALVSICADAGVDPGMPYLEMSERQRDLTVAWLYVWIAGSPIQFSGARDKHPNWEHEDGTERMSALVLNNYLKMANAIFAKYDMKPVGEDEYFFVGRGIRNPRRKV